MLSKRKCHKTISVNTLCYVCTGTNNMIIIQHHSNEQGPMAWKYDSQSNIHPFPHYHCAMIVPPMDFLILTNIQTIFRSL